MTERSARLSAGDDMLVHQLPRPVSVVHDDAPTWFDRLYFCLHGHDDRRILVVGAGVYPNAGLIDGYAALVHGDEQRNLRFSDGLGDDRLRAEVGPLRWEVLEPLQRWRLVIGDNPQGFELDAVYTARAEPWLVDPIAVDHSEGPQTEFAHFFQAGRWEGTLTVDGAATDVAGWRGARDRSWGIRRTRERLGMHTWLAVQFDDVCIGVHYNEHRDGRPQHCDGAVMREGAEPARVTSLDHDIVLDDNGEMVSAWFGVAIDGELLEVECHSLHRGLYMAGAGYGGWHGVDHGDRHVEGERWALDGSHTPRTLSLGLVDKACRYVMDGVEGVGLLELALSRSSTYEYRPRRGGTRR